MARKRKRIFLGKRCLTLRDETEWVELVDAGVNMLCGANSDRILEVYRDLVDDQTASFAMKQGLYGYGDAARHILRELTGIT